MKKTDEEYIKDCYEFIKPHIGHQRLRPGVVMIVSGTIEVIPTSLEERREFFEKNMQI
jgi:hypothetical protein